MPRFDPSKVRRVFSEKNYIPGDPTSGYKYYYRGKPLTKGQLQKYQEYRSTLPKTSEKRQFKKRPPKIPKGIDVKRFAKGTQFYSRQGKLTWAKPMTVRGGKNPIHNWSRVHFRDFDGSIKLTSSKQKWGTDVGGKKGGSVCVLEGSKEWVRQIQVSIHALYTNAETFRIVVGQRAIKVFQNSFKYQQFYSNRTQKWKPLSDATLKKRARRGTGSRILKEYGDLLQSIQFKENEGTLTSSVYTDIVPANISHHKKHSICYAGYHNEGKGTYGSAWNGYKPKPYIKRKFMGHSSHLNPLTDSFMRKMMKLYLFDSVFLAKKA